MAHYAKIAIAVTIAILLAKVVAEKFMAPKTATA